MEVCPEAEGVYPSCVTEAGTEGELEEGYEGSCVFVVCVLCVCVCVCVCVCACVCVRGWVYPSCVTEAGPEGELEYE